jgi:hypothetical protein
MKSHLNNLKNKSGRWSFQLQEFRRKRFDLISHEPINGTHFRIFSGRAAQRGMTLIEVILYTVLLSLLLATIIQYEYDIHLQNIELIHDIQDATASST